MATDDLAGLLGDSGADTGKSWVSREELIELLGESGSARLIEVLGGARIYVPSPRSENFAPLAEKLGLETARKFCREYGETVVTLPARLFAARDRILKLRQSGLAPNEISRRIGCSERYVYTVLSRFSDR